LLPTIARQSRDAKSQVEAEILPSNSASLAVVTGGSRGLGFETARALKARGHKVLLVAKDAERLKDAAAELDCDFRAVDLADISAAKSTFEEILATFGTPEILVLAHGVMSEKMSKTLKTTNEEWRRVMVINLDSVFTALNILAAPMAQDRKGRVIVYSACLGRMSGPGNTGGLAPYRISKAGVNALVRNLAHETGLGSRGLLVDAICPNHTRTDMGGSDAPLSVAEGADTAIWLATREFDPENDKTGFLWEERQIIDW
jgi:NAD(P)-dependent dehydrogenase (short-subunit alcohol dehydrogenase family)